MFRYANKKRLEGENDFTNDIDMYYREVLSNNMDEEPYTKKSFTKKFARLIREYVESDPREKNRMDAFLNR